ncbi:uncharacterized protein LOC124671093 [Lolium rigidum]|uniref:uncharacterized protein LOC124671093 n=1 Tax=Lolium rigidum TaxID=89674 RepID=UPI001F5D5B32|nr:uncharacterized protein LOC124671093 [Lolium rigidum]
MTLTRHSQVAALSRLNLGRRRHTGEEHRPTLLPRRHTEEKIQPPAGSCSVRHPPPSRYLRRPAVQFFFSCRSLEYITALHTKLRATGGNKTKTPGPGAQSSLRALAQSCMKIGHTD